MKNKVLAIMLTAAMGLSLAACGGTEPEETAAVQEALAEEPEEPEEAEEPESSESLTLEELMALLTDRYVLEGSEGIDYAAGTENAPGEVLGLETDASAVDEGKAGEYPLTYTVTLKAESLGYASEGSSEGSSGETQGEAQEEPSGAATGEEAASDGDSGDSGVSTLSASAEDTVMETLYDGEGVTAYLGGGFLVVVVSRTVTVVTEEEAEALVSEGETVLVDGGEDYREVYGVPESTDGEEEDASETEGTTSGTVAADTIEGNTGSSSGSSSEGGSGNSSESTSGGTAGTAGAVSGNTGSSSGSSNAGSSSGSSGSSGTGSSSGSSGTSGSSGFHKHSYTSRVTKAATCTTAGVRTYTCSCGSSYTESIAATGHSYTSKVTKAATCTASGTKTYTCSKCGGSYTESVQALGHNWVSTYHEEAGHYEKVLVSEGYYDTEKSIVAVCNGCGWTSDDADEMIIHTVKEKCGYHTETVYNKIYINPVYETKWVVDTAAYTSYKCSRCGATK